jgi:ubiquinol-cytochrome c reductase cytochrome b subunit
VNAGRRFLVWLEHRTGLAAAVRSLLDEPVPGGARWFYALGGVLAFLLVMEMVTGILLAFYYAPTATDAWASVAFIQDQLTFGWFIRGMHSFGASAMVVVSALHLLQVVLFGAYRAPREANWVVGLALFGLVLLFCLSGHGLPWDQKGYWAKLVETTILGTTPGPGAALERIIQGGSSFGNLTVVHFYAFHALVLPVITTALVLLHLALVRRHKVTPPWNLTPSAIEATTERYWPGQAFRDIHLTAVTIGVLVALVVQFHGAALEGPADPTSGYQARPEWYARPLYQLRQIFEGAWEMIGIVFLPGLVGLALLLLPLLDRAPSRDLRRRLPVVVGVIAGLLGTVGLGLYSVRKDATDPRYLAHRATTEADARRARRLALAGVLPEGGMAVYRNDPQYLVRELWNDQCSNCHALTGQGGDGGPDLADYNSRAWITAFLRDPQGRLFMGPANKQGPGKGMPPFRGTDEELAALTEFVYHQTGASDADPSLVKQAESVFSDKDCDACHEVDGVSPARGPNLLRRGTLDWIQKVIDHSGRPELYGDRAKMPRFGRKLSPEEIRMLATFIYDQRSRQSTVDSRQ